MSRCTHFLYLVNFSLNSQPATYLSFICIQYVTHRKGQVDFKVSPVKQLEDGTWEYCETMEVRFSHNYHYYYRHNALIH